MTKFDFEALCPLTPSEISFSRALAASQPSAPPVNVGVQGCAV